MNTTVSHLLSTPTVGFLFVKASEWNDLSLMINFLVQLACGVVFTESTLVLSRYIHFLKSVRRHTHTTVFFLSISLSYTHRHECLFHIIGLYNIQSIQTLSLIYTLTHAHSHKQASIVSFSWKTFPLPWALALNVLPFNVLKNPELCERWQGWKWARVLSKVGQSGL